jgi:hypothetical protein
MIIYQEEIRVPGSFYRGYLIVMLILTGMYVTSFLYPNSSHYRLGDYLVGPLVLVLWFLTARQILTYRRAVIEIEPGVLVVTDGKERRLYRIEKEWRLASGTFNFIGVNARVQNKGMYRMNPNWAIYGVAREAARALVSDPGKIIPTRGLASLDAPTDVAKEEVPGDVMFRLWNYVWLQKQRMSCVVIRNQAGDKTKILPTNQPEALMKALQEATA